MKDLIYEIVSVTAVVAYFIPLVIVLLKKLWQVTPFLLFALYWLAGGLVNLLGFMPVSEPVSNAIGIAYNMLDMPLVMGIIYVSTSSAAVRKFSGFAVIGFAGAELVNLLLRGFSYESLKYTLAIGLLLVLTLIVWEIILYLQKISHSGRERGLLFIYAALLFEYGTYIIIYIFEYYLDEISSATDNYLVYYISSVIALVIAICGYLTQGIRRAA